MDGQRFDNLTKRLAAGVPRRGFVKGLAGGVVAGAAALLGRSGADARKVTQAYCGNMTCAEDPSVCRDGCACCVFGNGNSRCMPPKDCERLGGEGLCNPAVSVCCHGQACTEGQVCNEVTGECYVPTCENQLDPVTCAQAGGCPGCVVNGECNFACAPGAVCTVAAEGQRICGYPTADCPGAVFCSTSEDCGDGEICAVSCCNGGDKICFTTVDCAA